MNMKRITSAVLSLVMALGAIVPASIQPVSAAWEDKVDKDGNPLTYLEIIAAPDDIVDSIDRKIKLEKINAAVKNALTERERKIMMLRYGLNKSGKHFAQRDVAKMLGISRSYVSRLEKSAIEKIREYAKIR